MKYNEPVPLIWGPRSRRQRSLLSTAAAFQNSQRLARGVAYVTKCDARQCNNGCHEQGGTCVWSEVLKTVSEQSPGVHV